MAGNEFDRLAPAIAVSSVPTFLVEVGELGEKRALCALRGPMFIEVDAYMLLTAYFAPCSLAYDANANAGSMVSVLGVAL